MKRVVTCLVALTLALPARAHRLDEYLQAARLDITAKRVELELDLTPGVEVAPALCALIDVDSDGQISDAEARTYARRVLAQLVVDLDGERREPTLLDVHAPSCADMKSGVGILRLRASTTFAPLSAARHELHFRNDHRPTASVYLVNALQPISADVRIDRQDRDELQSESRITFTVSPSSPVSQGWSAIVPTLLVLGAAALVALFWRK